MSKSLGTTTNGTEQRNPHTFSFCQTLVILSGLEGQYDCFWTTKRITPRSLTLISSQCEAREQQAMTEKRNMLKCSFKHC